MSCTQVVDVMKDNLDKVLERDAKLSTLENRAGKLQKELIDAADYIYATHLIVLFFAKKINSFFRHFTNWCITIYNKC